jgi:hypothetical protein
MHVRVVAQMKYFKKLDCTSFVIEENHVDFFLQHILNMAFVHY